MSSEYDTGFIAGYQEGDANGYTTGYDAGFSVGYEEGYKDGCEDEYNRKYTKTQNETQVSDNTFKSVFPKHLKTDKDFLQKLQKSKEDCIAHIDFDKIHSVMQHLDWKWFTGDDVSVPSMSKLVLFAQKQLNTAVQGFLQNDCNEYFASSGGFKASVHGFADGFCRVTLEFVVSDWDSEIESNTGGEE